MACFGITSEYVADLHPSIGTSEFRRHILGHLILYVPGMSILSEIIYSVQQILCIPYDLAIYNIHNGDPRPFLISPYKILSTHSGETLDPP